MTTEPSDLLATLQAFESEEALNAALLAPFRPALEAMSGGVYVFGAQRLGAMACTALEAAGFEVLGFFDNDPGKQQQAFAGKPVLSPQGLSAGWAHPVVIASTVHLGAIWRQLLGLECRHVLPYHLLSVWNAAQFPYCFTFEGAQADLFAHREAYAALFQQLGDEESRRALAQVLRFRLTMRPEYAPSPFAEQYFAPDLVHLGEREVFVDGGAYDGDTTLAFIRRSGGRYRQIYAFEPDPQLVEKARAQVGGYSNVTIRAEGLSRQAEILRFQATGDPGGRLDGEGGIEVRVSSLDEAVTEPITLLKMDIEGAERAALAGAARHLRDEGPTLAIAAYHRPDDLWQLPRLIAGINPRYRFYLRHYTDSPLETVLYGVIE